ncbi:hypothetical protein ACFE04_009952 [Oxalis oulophora]
MRAGLSTIQQTLTPEAATVLNQSISEAGRRNHGQTTPLHVAATLLSSPSGYLRQACIKSHPNSSHPLQCRALELCFRVALERLPAAQNIGPGAEPPISNALMAGSNSIGLVGFRGSPLSVANRNFYLNPRLQQNSSNIQQLGQQRGEEVRKVMDIFSRSKKRNPVLVGESEPELVLKESIRRLESEEWTSMRNVQVIHFEVGLDKSQLESKLVEIGDMIERKVANSDAGVILNLGDLKWLVEQPQSMAGKTTVIEMGKLLVRFAGRLWLICTATCETYLRCQVYHPSMENDWDLQAVPITTRAPQLSMVPRLGTNGILSRSVESLSPLKTFSLSTAVTPRRLSENSDPTRRTHCCPQCTSNYEEELAKFINESEKSSSEVKSETSKPSLPQWLQDAKTQDRDSEVTDHKAAEDNNLNLKQKSQDLQKKWNDTCLRLHPSFHQPSAGPERIVPAPIALTGLYNQNIMSRQPFQPKLQQNKLIRESLQLNPHLVPTCAPERISTPSDSPVRTDLILGATHDNIHHEQVKDFLGCIPSEPPSKIKDLQNDRCQTPVDADSFKRLLKGLMEKVWWQLDAASAVTATVTRSKLENGKRRGDMWLLFTGPDNIGKKMMASALSELAYGTSPITISLGSRRDDVSPIMNFRGKTALDRIVEAVRRNPFSVIVLSDIDEADKLILGSVKRAMERGRLTDSHGREISLGNIIFILMENSRGRLLDEKKLTSLASGAWQLKLSACRKALKRRPHWLQGEDRTHKIKKDSLTFDLNEAAVENDDKADGSHNSSDLMIDHEEDHIPRTQLMSPAARDLLSSVDEPINFKPLDFGAIKLNTARVIRKFFSTIVGGEFWIEIPDESLEKITSGVWLNETGLRDWTENVLAPSLHELKLGLSLISDECLVVRLELDNESGNRKVGHWLPSSIKVVVDGL